MHETQMYLQGQQLQRQPDNGDGNKESDPLRNIDNGKKQSDPLKKHR